MLHVKTDTKAIRGSTKIRLKRQTVEFIELHLSAIPLFNLVI